MAPLGPRGFHPFPVTSARSVLLAALSLWQGVGVSEPQFLHLQSGVMTQTWPACRNCTFMSCSDYLLSFFLTPLSALLSLPR